MTTMDERNQECFGGMICRNLQVRLLPCIQYVPRNIGKLIPEYRCHIPEEASVCVCVCVCVCVHRCEKTQTSHIIHWTFIIKRQYAFCEVK